MHRTRKKKKTIQQRCIINSYEKEKKKKLQYKSLHFMDDANMDNA